MEPRPWSEDGATEIEKALLYAGRSEGPRKGAELRILAAIEGQSPSVPTIRPAGVARWVKLGLVAVVAGGAALLTYQLSRTREVAARLMEPSWLAPKAAPRLAASTDGSGSAKAVVPREVSESLEPARRTIATGRRREATQRQSDSHSLGEETKALDHAREALAARQPSEALRLLDEHRRRFPSGLLRPEAMILRLAALLQAGEHEAADSLARRLLSDAAYSSYVPRIQSLLREVK